MNYYRDYTCTKKFEQDFIVCVPNIMYLSERDSYEFYQVLKVPFVEAHGLEGLIFGTSIYDRMYIKEKLPNLFLGKNYNNLKIIFK